MICYRTMSGKDHTFSVRKPEANYDAGSLRPPWNPTTRCSLALIEDMNFFWLEMRGNIMQRSASAIYWSLLAPIAAETSPQFYIVHGGRLAVENQHTTFSRIQSPLSLQPRYCCNAELLRPGKQTTFQSNICRTFKFTLFPAIQPFHSANSSSCWTPSPTPGQLLIHSGHVPAKTFGTPCHAYLLSPLIKTASPDLNLITAILALPSASLPSSPAMKIPSQPKEILTSGLSHSSLTSRCRLSVSPGEYRLTIAASALIGKTFSTRPLMSAGKDGGAVEG